MEKLVDPNLERIMRQPEAVPQKTLREHLRGTRIAVEALRQECAAQEIASEDARRLGIVNIAPPEHIRTVVDRVLADIRPHVLCADVRPDDGSRD